MPADSLLAFPQFAAALAVLPRLGGALALIPMPGWRVSAPAARVLLAVVLAAALAPAAAARGTLPATPGGLALWLMTETTLGLYAGLAAALAGEALLFGFQSIALQAGYSYALTVNPESDADSGVLAALAQILASLLFFAAGLDRFVLKSFARSLEVWPVGGVELHAGMAETLVRLGGAVLELGARLALPIAAMLLVADIALALLSRLHAQLQLLTMAFPLKMLAALFMLTALVPAMQAIYRAAAARSMAGVAEALR
jgi:flagellar biosynthetic protein FliR